MSFRASTLTFVLLLLVVPLSARADDEVVPAADCVPVAEALSSAVATGTVLQTLLDLPAPVAQCTYTCGPLGLCPDILDTPPGQCINGCCVYETSCETTCSFDIDCGPQASCWSGCCYFWNH